MKSYIKIVKAMFSGNKRVLAEAFSVMVILLALEMTIPVCVNKMIKKKKRRKKQGALILLFLKTAIHAMWLSI